MSMIMDHIVEQERVAIKQALVKFVQWMKSGNGDYLDGSGDYINACCKDQIEEALERYFDKEMPDPPPSKPSTCTPNCKPIGNTGMVAHSLACPTIRERVKYENVCDDQLFKR